MVSSPTLKTKEDEDLGNDVYRFRRAMREMDRIVQKWQGDELFRITLLRPTDLAKWLRVSDAAIYEWHRDGVLPDPISLKDNPRTAQGNINSKVLRWRYSDIVAWLETRPVVRRG